MVFFDRIRVMKYAKENNIIHKDTTTTCRYIKSIGNVAMNCPKTIGNKSAPMDPEIIMEDTIRLVTVMCCSIHKIPHA